MMFKHDTRPDAEVRDDELPAGDRQVVDGELVDEYDGRARPVDATTDDTVVTDARADHDPDDDSDEVVDDGEPGADGPDAATTFDHAADEDEDIVADDEPTALTDEAADDDDDDALDRDTVAGHDAAADEDLPDADLADEADALTAADADAVTPFTPDEGADAEPVVPADTLPGYDATPGPAEPTAVDEPAALVPGAVTDEPGAGRWADADGQAFRDRWRDVQLRFVDDPRGAAAEAGTLVGEAVEAFTAALARQRQELDAWQSTEGDDTEIFRVAVRRYRDLLDKIVSS
ncbi:hypothetical protein [Luedemannella flava]|uniref:hypothetical protein n=1 Tax=Luedemannella flava TaxID=349316 RepID=UPI0031DCD49D